MVDVLTAPGIEFTQAQLQGGVTFTESVNSGDNIMLGSCVANKIEFSVLDLHYTEMVHHAGTEFVYSTLDLLPYGFSEDNLLVFQNGDRYYLAANQQAIGRFTVQKPERIDESKWKFTGLDRMARFDVIVDGWYGGIAFPITLKNLLLSLCSYCDVEMKTQSFTNQNFQVKNNFMGSEIKGRDVLGWIAEVAASFARINAEGKLELAFYADTDITISKVSSSRVSDYEVQKISKLQVKATEDDIGVIVGTGTNTYIIQANPLLFTATDAEIRPAAEAIYAKIKDLAYTPLEIETFAEYAPCRAGDIVQVQTRRGAYSACITSRIVNGRKVTLASVGGENRNQLQSVNRHIQQMRGKTNEIIANVEQLSVKLTDLDSDTQAQFIIQAGQIAAEVSRATLAEGMLSSSITIQAGQIASKVSQTDYNGNTVASLINQTATSILIQAARINLTGYVTATDLVTGNLTVRGSFVTTNSSGTIKVQDGSLYVAYGNNGSNTGVINYRGTTLSIRSGVGFGATGHIEIAANNSISIQPGGGTSSTVFIGSGSSNDVVHIGSSSSSLSQLNAYGYRARGNAGYTGSISYAKPSGSSGTITVTGGIITGVT